MNEDYVSYEVAKQLKEKGFDIHYSTHFYKNNKLECYMDDRKKYWLQKDEYAAPSLYIAQKWLRSHGYHVEVVYMRNDLWVYEILTIPHHDLVELADRIITNFISYEYALNAGILEALKLI